MKTGVRKFPWIDFTEKVVSILTIAQCGKVLQNAITICLKKDANFPSNWSKLDFNVILLKLSFLYIDETCYNLAENLVGLPWAAQADSQLNFGRPHQCKQMIALDNTGFLCNIQGVEGYSNYFTE